MLTPPENLASKTTNPDDPPIAGNEDPDIELAGTITVQVKAVVKGQEDALKKRVGEHYGLLRMFLIVHLSKTCWMKQLKNSAKLIFWLIRRAEPNVCQRLIFPKKIGMTLWKPI